MGGYDLGPKPMAASLLEWAQDGLVNAIGGCCGTTPDHIKAFAEAVEGLKPARKVPEHIPTTHAHRHTHTHSPTHTHTHTHTHTQIPDHPNYMRLCGLEPFVIEPTSVFANIGERCNVAGSILFKKLIVQNDWGKAAEIAQNQVESGAQLLDGLFPPP